MNQSHSTYSPRAGCGASRKSASADGGEETTGRKAGTDASPPIQRPRIWARREPRLRSKARLAHKPDLDASALGFSFVDGSLSLDSRDEGIGVRCGW